MSVGERPGLVAKIGRLSVLVVLVLFAFSSAIPVSIALAACGNSDGAQTVGSGALGSQSGSSFQALTWAKTHGGSGLDDAASIQQTSDGGYVVAGTSTSFGTASSEAWVVKLDATGGVQWQKAYGGAGGNNELDSIQQTSDGGYVVSGYTNSFNGGVDAPLDAWVFKLGVTGNVQWQMTYGRGGTEDDVANNVRQTSDGGYVVAGELVFDAFNHTAWVFKLDHKGDISWQKTYGARGPSAADGVLYSIEQTADGGYVVAGYTTTFGAGSYEAWVLKLDNYGNVEWQRTYGGISIDAAFSVTQTMPDEGYVVAGDSYSFSGGRDDAWVLRLDTNGRVLWQQTYGGRSYDFAKSVSKTAEGGFVVTGVTYSFGSGHGNAWVFKINSSGGLVWQKTFGGSYFDEGVSGEATTDGGFVVAATTLSFGRHPKSENVWVLKLDADGNNCVARSTSARAYPTFATVTSTHVIARHSSATATPANGFVMKTHANIDTQC